MVRLYVELERHNAALTFVQGSIVAVKDKDMVGGGGGGGGGGRRGRREGSKTEIQLLNIERVVLG